MTNVKATFEGLIPSTTYTGVLSRYDGNPAAGGFDFRDAYLITEHAIQVFGYQGTGYQTEIRGDCEGFFSAYTNTSNGYSKGYFLSPTSETFNMKIGHFTSAWDVSQTVTFTGYRSGHMTGKITIKLNWSTATTIDFANYGSDFRHITEFKEFSNTATGGTFGVGWQVVFDNLKVHWNGAVPGHIGSRAHVSHPVMGATGHQGNATAAHSDLGIRGFGSGGYHGELARLGMHGHETDNLTSQFQLPACEHFGV